MQILRYGSVGPIVNFAQLGLQRAGYLPSEPDGIFGSMTQNAVQRFQRAYGLRQDGIIGPKTWAELTPWLTGFREITVQRGDSYFRFAEKFGTTILALETANPQVDPLNLRIGQKLIVPLSFPVVPESIPFTSTVLLYSIRGLRARYPYLYVDSIGDSVLGTPLYLLRIGAGENRVFYNGAHHANEWITAQLLMKYIERYAYAYMEDRPVGNIRASELYRKTALSVVPMVNPDGVDLVTGELAAGTKAHFDALTMNGSAEGFPQNWKANIRGVDLNLQYPAGWDKARETKFAQGFTKPGPRDYVGPEPLSEPEAGAVYAFTRKNDFTLTLSYHTQGEVIYWKYLDFEPAGSRRIGLEFSRLSGYSLELTPAESAYAGYKDWFIQAYDRPGYTIEAGSGVNPLPLDQLPKIYAENEALLSYAQIAATEEE